MTSVAAVVLTLNEEPRIEGCLKHLRPYIDFILVLDGCSTDKTVEIAKKYADKVVIKPFSGSFAEEKNYARALVPNEYSWILWVDADERFDPGLLRDIKEHIRFAEESLSICWRFPRCNFDGRDFPDYQVRLIKNSGDIEWRGKVHEVPYLKTEDIPLDQLDRIITGDEHPIVHLERRSDQKRPWW